MRLRRNDPHSGLTTFVSGGNKRLGSFKRLSFGSNSALQAVNSTKVEHMSRFRPAVAVLLASIIPWVCVANTTVLQRGIAKVSIVKLSHAIKFSHKNLIVVPLEDCAVLINGHRTALKEGEYKEFTAGYDLSLRPVSAANPRLALVEVVTSFQALTITSTSLAAHQDLEDASDRNQTLVVALDNLEIRDEQSLAAEGEPWKPSEIKIIRLQRGETGWLDHGKHRVRNAGSTVARFITIEW